jgi:hypothetical protein
MDCGGGCYPIYIDKCTLAKLINSYQSHAKRGDDGRLSTIAVPITVAGPTQSL